MFESGSSPKGSWRSLYKRATEKILKWDFSYKQTQALLNVSDDESCPFCQVSEEFIILLSTFGANLRFYRELEYTVNRKFLSRIVYFWSQIFDKQQRLVR